MGKYILRGNTFIDGRDYGPGDEVELDDTRGKQLHEQGLVDTPESARKAQDQRSEQSQAEQDAVKAAGDLEANKVRAAEETRAGYSTAPETPKPPKPAAKK